MNHHERMPVSKLRYEVEDRVAFITHRNCYRCHSVNPDGTPALPPQVLPVHPAAAPPTPAH